MCLEKEHLLRCHQSLERRRSLLIAYQTLQDVSSMFSNVTLAHGDFHNENLLFDPMTHQLTGLLDLEEAHLGDCLQDVFHFIRLGCCHAGFHGSYLEKARTFMKTYLQIRPFPFQTIQYAYRAYIIQKLSVPFFEMLSTQKQDLSFFNYVERDLTIFQHMLYEEELILSYLTT